MYATHYFPARTLRYWCYEDPNAYEHIELLPIRATGDCFDPAMFMPCQYDVCYCLFHHGGSLAQSLVMLPQNLYHTRTNTPWPLTHSDSWMKFIQLQPVFFSSTVVLAGAGVRARAKDLELPDQVWAGEDTAVFFSAITYNMRQNYCQQVPSTLLTTPVSGDCHSPYSVPPWDGSLESRQVVSEYHDAEWRPGSCRDRGFFVLHSVTLNVTDCHAEASWVEENARRLPVLSINSSRVIYFI